MRQRNAWLIVACCALLVACTGSERSGEGPWHEPLPSIAVDVSVAADSHVVLETVRSLPAPEIRIPALLQPDPNHVSPVVAPVTGLVIRIAEERDVRRGETLAVMGQGSEEAGREVPVRAAKDGTWRPRHQPRQIVWQDNPLGVLEERGFWLAVGSVSDIDASFVHEDDPAVVLLGTETDAKHHGRPGRVEWVRRESRASFSTEVAVEVRGREQEFVGRGFATAVVTPSGPGDSLAAVPSSAVVQLPLGPAVFVPVGPGRYGVRWVTTGPTVHGKVLVRDGVRPGASVVAHGLAALVEAARDSLARRAGKR